MGLLKKIKEGYDEEDIFNINDWFLDIFPRMLWEYANRTIGYPPNNDILKEEVLIMPKEWVETQKNIINSILKKNGFSEKFSIQDPFCCWLLIILRMKHCFEMSNDDNEIYDLYRMNNMSAKISEEIDKNFNEAIRLFKKYFFSLWY